MTDKLFTTKRIISVCDAALDEAVDYDNMDINAYIKTFSEDLVKVKEGMVPTWITVQGLKKMELLHIFDSITGDYKRKAYAFSAGCVNIQKPNGTLLIPDKSVKDWQNDWFEQICDEYGMDYVIAVGSAIIAISKLPKV